MKRSPWNVVEPFIFACIDAAWPHSPVEMRCGLEAVSSNGHCEIIQVAMCYTHWPEVSVHCVSSLKHPQELGQWPEVRFAITQTWQ